MKNSLKGFTDAHEDDFCGIVAFDIVFPEVQGQLVSCKIDFEGFVFFVAPVDL